MGVSELMEGVVSPHHLPSPAPVQDGGWQSDAVARARDLAQSLLPPGSKRWRHSQTAAVAAAEAGLVLDDHECTLLTSAAWVHDIGYHHPTPATGFHPIDGAQLLLRAGWPSRLASLVAHHSEARFMADVRGLSAELAVWPRESGPVADGLVYADMTSAPGGGRTGVLERLAEVRRRHSGEPLVRAVARRRREPFLVMAAARTDLTLWRAGHRGHFVHPSRLRSTSRWASPSSWRTGTRAARRSTWRPRCMGRALWSICPRPCCLLGSSRSRTTCCSRRSRFTDAPRVTPGETARR